VCCTPGIRQSLCWPCARLKHTVNPDFAMCLTATHGKSWRLGAGVSFCRVSSFRCVLLTTKVWIRRVPSVCRVGLTTKTKYTVCLAFAVCLSCTHGKSGLYRVLLTANSQTKHRLSDSELCYVFNPTLINKVTDLRMMPMPMPSICVSAYGCLFIITFGAIPGLVATSYFF